MNHQWDDVSKNDAFQEPIPGTAFFNSIPFPIHRFRAREASLIPSDFDANDDQLTVNESVDELTPGPSCFVPISPLHLYNTKKAAQDKAPCNYLPEGYTPPKGHVFVFTDCRMYQEPVGPNITYRKIWHFNLVANNLLPQELRRLKQGKPINFARSIRQMPWLNCDIRAAAEPVKLRRGPDDLLLQKNEIMVRLYRAMEHVHENATDPAHKLLANEIHTYIALEKPSIEQLMDKKPLAKDLFNFLCGVDLEEVAGEAALQFLYHMQERYGWEWRDKYEAAEEVR